MSVRAAHSMTSCASAVRGISGLGDGVGVGGTVGDGTGAALSSYLSSNGKTLNSSGINEVLSYLRTHALTTE